jgi:hypothetical protein
MPTLLIITNQSGKIVATMHENPNAKAMIAPREGQSMYRLENVPIEVTGHANPETYHAAITKHFAAHKAHAKPFDPTR